MAEASFYLSAVIADEQFESLGELVSSYKQIRHGKMEKKKKERMKVHSNRMKMETTLGQICPSHENDRRMSISVLLCPAFMRNIIYIYDTASLLHANRIENA